MHAVQLLVFCFLLTIRLDALIYLMVVRYTVYLSTILRFLFKTMSRRTGGLHDFRLISIKGLTKR